MDLKYLMFFLTCVFLAPHQINCRPGFSIKQVKRNLNQIWKDFEKTNVPRVKKPKRKVKVRSQETFEEVYTSDAFSNCRAVRLRPGEFCKHLIVEDGAVFATDQQLEGDEGIFQIEVYGKDLVRLKYVTTGEYIGINKHGKTFTTDKSNDENLFVHVIEENTIMDTFASWKYYMEQGRYDLFLGIKKKKNGICKTVNAKRTKADQKTNQFFWNNNNIDQEKYCKRS